MASGRTWSPESGPLTVRMMEAQDGKLYISVEDMLEILLYFQKNMEEFVDSDFTLIKIDKEELN